MTRVAGGGAVVTRPGTYDVRRPLARTGAPYGQYLLEDVVAGKVDAPLQVFLNAWVLTAAQREALREVTQGKACVWCYAPGYHDSDRPSLDAMRELTGFRLEPVSPPKAWASPTPAGKARGVQAPFGVDGPVRPLFAALDAAPEETLATYADGSAAVALRRSDQGLSAFVGAPGLTSEVLRAVAREAKVHLFTEVDCNVWANGPFLVLHAPAEGAYEVNTGRPTPVVDMLTGQTIAQGPGFAMPLAFGETRVLRY
jgi:hypothetical protein